MTALPSSSAIHRRLAKRVAIATLALGAGTATVAYVTEQGRLESAVAEVALLEVGRLELAVAPLLDRRDALTPDEMQAALDLFSRGRGDAEMRDGSFVLARLYDAAGRVLGELDDEEHANLAEVRGRFEELEFTALPEGQVRTVTAEVGGQTYIGVRVPLAASDGLPAAQVVGAFAIEDETLARLRGRALRTVGYVLLVILSTVAVLYPVIAGLITHLARSTLSLLDANLEMLRALGSAIAKRDSDTDAHNYRVSIYSVALAESIGASETQVRSLIKGALLHDAGKLGIRDDVLLKPGPLDAEEFAVMKTHVEHGLEITSRVRWLADARDVVGGHHEKFDGSGYPRGLRAEAIPRNARIFAIADVFDALTSRRPYKEPMSFEAAMEILEEGRGRHFDPELLDAFVRIAKDLHDEYSAREDDRARERLSELTDHYFRRDVAASAA